MHHALHILGASDKERQRGTKGGKEGQREAKRDKGRQREAKNSHRSLLAMDTGPQQHLRKNDN